MAKPPPPLAPPLSRRDVRDHIRGCFSQIKEKDVQVVFSSRNNILIIDLILRTFGYTGENFGRGAMSFDLDEEHYMMSGLTRLYNVHRSQ